MLLLLLVACQYSLHNNIVTMCVMYKQSRNTASFRHVVRYICRVLCTVNSMHVICTGACSHSCIRSGHFRSMRLTPLLVQSKRVSTRMMCEPPPKCRTRQDRDLSKRLWPHLPRLLCRSSHMLQQCRFGFVGCPPLSENPVPTTLSILHWLNTFSCTYTYTTTGNLYSL